MRYANSQKNQCVAAPLANYIVDNLALYYLNKELKN